MAFSEELVNGICVVKSIENIANVTNAQEFKNFLFVRIDEGVRNIVIDFSDIEMIDSTFLGAMVVVYRKALPLGGKFKICNINESIATLLGLTKLNETFPVFQSLDDALKSF